MTKCQDAINVAHPFGVKLWKPALYKKVGNIQIKAEDDLRGGQADDLILLVLHPTSTNGEVSDSVAKRAFGFTSCHQKTRWWTITWSSKEWKVSSRIMYIQRCWKRISQIDSIRGQHSLHESDDGCCLCDIQCRSFAISLSQCIHNLTLGCLPYGPGINYGWYVGNLPDLGLDLLIDPGIKAAQPARKEPTSQNTRLRKDKREEGWGVGAGTQASPLPYPVMRRLQHLNIPKHCRGSGSPWRRLTRIWNPLNL